MDENIVLTVQVSPGLGQSYLELLGIELGLFCMTNMIFRSITDYHNLNGKHSF